MKRILLSIILIIFAILQLHCADLETVGSKRKKVFNNEKYISLAVAWQKKCVEEPNELDNWISLFFAVKYSKFGKKTGVFRKNKDANLKYVIDGIKKNIGENYFYWYAVSETKDYPDNMESLKKSHKLNNKYDETIVSMLTWYVRQNDYDKTEEFCRKLYNSKSYPEYYLYLGYNYLSAADENSIIFTNGDNDTFPLWILQNVHNYRKDILVLNVNLAYDPHYLEKLLVSKGIKWKKKKNYQFSDLMDFLIEKYPEKSLYFGITVMDQFKSKYQKNLYNEGFLEKYSNKKYNNLAVFINNMENKYLFDLLRMNFYKEDIPERSHIDTRMNMNYLALTMRLSEHYSQSGSKGRAEKWKLLSIKLAEKAGRKDIADYLNRI